MTVIIIVHDSDRTNRIYRMNKIHLNFCLLGYTYKLQRELILVLYNMRTDLKCVCSISKPAQSQTHSARGKYNVGLILNLSHCYL